MSEGNIRIERNPVPPPGANPAATVPKPEDVKAARAAAHEKFAKSEQESEAARISALPPAMPEDKVAQDQVETIDVDMPNGMHVTFGPPPGVSLLMRSARILGEESRNQAMNGLCQILLCVRSVNGTPIEQITSKGDLERLANRLGDDAIQILTIHHGQVWPGLTLAAIPAIKKNLRK